MSVAPIRFRHGLLPLLGYPRGSGLRQAFSVADGYDLALVSAFRVTIAPRRADASAPWVGSIAADDAFSGRVFTLDFADDALSDDDDELELAAITAEKNCLWAVDALNADGELEWRLQGDLRFASPYGADGGETAAIVETGISLAITSDITIAVTILGNSEAGGTVDNAAVVAAIEEDPGSARAALELGSAATAASEDFDPAGAAETAQDNVTALVQDLEDSLGGAARLNVGTSADTVAAGDDARFSNARTPTAHKASHATGGSDPLSPADIGAATALQGAAADAAKAITDLIAVTEATNLDTLRAKVAGLDAAIVLQGTWDASAGTFPGSGAAQAGNTWRVSVAGAVNGVAFNVGDRVMAVVDNASTTTFVDNWFHEDYTDRVESVVGLIGSITASALRSALNVADGANNYTLSAPTTTVLGGVKRNTGSAGQFVTGIAPDGSLERDTPAGGGGSISNPNVAYIRSDGNDGTGEIGNAAKPFMTAQAAWNAGARVLDLGVGSFSISHTSDITSINQEDVFVRGCGKDRTSLSLAWTGTDGETGTPPETSATGGNGRQPSLLNLSSDRSVAISVVLTGGSGGNGGSGPSGTSESSSGVGGNGGTGSDHPSFLLSGIYLASFSTAAGSGGSGGPPGTDMGGGSGSSGDAGFAGGSSGTSAVVEFSNVVMDLTTQPHGINQLGVSYNGSFLTF